MAKKNIQHVAFFDAEFTADSAHDRGIQEMIQCALIVHEVELSEDNVLLSMTDAPVYTYKTFVKPRYNKKLSKYIKDLTGIIQSDVDAGKPFDVVLDDIYNIFNIYQIAHVMTWGPDKTMLKYNCIVLDCDKRKAKSIYNRFDDVSQRLSDFLGYNMALSQHRACQLLHIKEFGEMHDAYCDAVNLSKIIKEFCGQKMP